MHAHRWVDLLLVTVIGVVGTVAPPSFGRNTDPALKRLEDSPRHHEWVEIKTKTGRTVRAFLVFPEVDKPVPGVLVIHENRGLTDWVRGVADQLAEAGYVALAPDLLSQTGPGKGGTESFASSNDARDAIYRLPADQVLDDLDACFQQLRKMKATTEKVAVGGFCWGGSRTFLYATHNPQVSLACVFYGSAPDNAEQLARIKAPVHGFYGGKDYRITGKVPEVAEMMNKAGKPFEPVTYKDAGHGFMRSGEASDADPANRTARTEAWARWKKLLAKLATP